MNIVVGNCAGTFSTILNYCSWLCLEDYFENAYTIQLHACNKTHDMNNVLTPVSKPYIRSGDFDRKLLEDNILKKYFHSEVLYEDGDPASKGLPQGTVTFRPSPIKDKYPDYFIFTDHYPHLFRDSIMAYNEDIFRYDGKGGMKVCYEDRQQLNIVRQSFNAQWHKFSNYTDEFGKKLNEEEMILENKKPLAVMVRTMHHYVDPRTGKVFDGSEDEFIKKIVESVKTRFNSGYRVDNPNVERSIEFDSILLTTQNQPYVDAFEKEFGDLLLVTDRPRFSDMNDWRGVGKDWYKLSDEEYETEFGNCSLDCILTAKAEHVMGSCSNMFMGVLMMNQYLTFDMIDSLNDFWGA